MRRLSPRISRLTLLGLLFALLGSCSNGDSSDDPPAPFNRPPVIASLQANPMSVLPGQSSSLSVAATDPDGDSLTYSWAATAGTLTGAGSAVSWQAPGVPGTCTVSVTVSDGASSDLASVDLAVVTPDAWLAGTYTIAGFEHDIAGSIHMAVTGTLAFDGSGAFSGTMLVNGDGTIESQSVASTYAVTPAGDVTIDDGGGGILAGGLDAAHEVAVVARVTDSMNPLIVIAVKRSGTYTQGSLSGDYHVAAYHWDGGGGTPAYAALTGTGSFDPIGGAFAFTAANNWGGTVSPVSVALDYAVAADGTVTLSDPVDSEVEFNGGISADGGILVGASTRSGGKPMLLVALRKSGTFAADTMTGWHRTVSMGAGGGGASSWTGERYFDGASGWTASGALNDNGTISATSSSGTYTITADGRMTMTVVPRVFELGVREGGAAAAGAVITSLEAPRFVFSVRK